MGEVPEHWLGPLESAANRSGTVLMECSTRLGGLRPRLESQRRFFQDRMDLGARAAGRPSGFGALREKPRRGRRWRDRALRSATNSARDPCRSPVHIVEVPFAHKS